ncbi:Hypothetical predicted protein [Olea europaea subsp. europaea]|uniref:Uncharacterized protein n=1 Tax=Olea europaea subsp. europaea TaxID=158383 RepID=A0A8S0T4U3_OLEEU|nr:Hypothetical predicted protein [Olea europaea subsp. europaea]
MAFPMRIQPIDLQLYSESSFRNDVVKPPVLKSRLKRLFDRQFSSVLRISATEKPSTGGEKDGGVPADAAVPEFEPSSLYLDKMVQNFIEDNEKQSGPAGAKYGRNRYNCFNGNSNDSSDDEFDFFDSYTPGSSFNDPSDTLKSLIPCASIEERNLLADTSKIVENNKLCKGKDDLRKIVAKGLITLGYNASICKSKWEKSSSTPAGEYEYIDVIIKCERLLIDIDFRSEFEIARSTSSYKGILQSLPYIFVGKSDRLLQIVSIVSEAARHSFKKKGMHVAPWRKAEYMTSKWLGPHTRSAPVAIEEPTEANPESNPIPMPSESGELDLIFGEEMTLSEANDPVETLPESMWQLPAVKVKRANEGTITGLATLLKEKL